MDYSCFFIKDKAMFGSFPIQSSVNELEENGVRFFVNLTHDSEKKIVPYTTNYTYINYPISDHNIPEDLYTFSKFIIQLSRIIRELKPMEKLYIHCRGGRTRSATIASILLCYMFSLSPYESLQYTTKCYINRTILKDKWRKLGSPQTYVQKKFVYKCFHPINLNILLKNILTYSISIEEIGDFENIQDILNHYKKQFMIDSNNKCFHSFLSKKNEIRDWISIQDNIIKFLISVVLDNNEDMKESFLRSFLRPISISYIEQHVYWKNLGVDANKFVKILTSLRVKFLLERNTSVV